MAVKRFMADTEHVLRLFPTPVIIKHVAGANELNAELENVIRKRMASDEGLKKSNLGGWHSKTDFLDWAGDAGRLVAQEIVGLANTHTVGPKGQLINPQWRIAAWANVSGGGHSNIAHSHGAAYWSSVYYVRVDQGSGGQLLLHDPRMPALRMHAPALQFGRCGPEGMARIKPVEGQIVLFPSWLSHSVEPWAGEGERISVALNLAAPPPRLRDRGQNPIS
jgi:uncharacterized protein (TIGR02466 family)